MYKLLLRQHIRYKPKTVSELSFINIYYDAYYRFLLKINSLKQFSKPIIFKLLQICYVFLRTYTYLLLGEHHSL